MSDTTTIGSSSATERGYPTLENIEVHPTFRGWHPAVVPMPRRRKLAASDPFLSLAARHRKLYGRKRPLEQAAWRTRDLPDDNPRRQKILAALADLDPKITKLEDAMVQCVATTPGVLIEQINVFRDWVDFRREAMVDAVIAGLRNIVPRGDAA
ncbi:MAG TPA: hypothetical protein VFC56_15890 [Stellaceae bacterium]|nr:hypothetical protein [Stellaceae bacterium]